MGISNDMSTGKAAMELLMEVMRYYNSGYDADIIAMMTGLSEETVKVLVDIAKAVEKKKKK